MCRVSPVSARLLRPHCADLPRLAEQSSGVMNWPSVVKAAGAVVLGEGAERLPQTLCFAADGFGSELQVMSLDLAGVMVSAGSACSSGKVKASRVVEAMGRKDLAPYALRVSGGWASSAERLAPLRRGLAGRATPKPARGRSPDGYRRQDPRTGQGAGALSARLHHRHRAGLRAQGAERGHRPLHLGQQGRAGVDAGMAAGSLSPLAGAWTSPTGPRSTIRPSTIRTSTTTPRRRPRTRRRASTRSIRSCWRPTRSSASRLREQEVLAGVEGAPKYAVDAVFDCVSVVTTFKKELAEGRRHLLSICEAIREHPELVRKYLGSVVPVVATTTLRPQQRGLLGRHLRLCAAGRALPDGAVDLFPHERRRRAASSSAR